MSSLLDDHIRSTLDRFRVALTGQLEAELNASASDITRALHESRNQAVKEAYERGVAEARREAAEQLSNAQARFQLERDGFQRDRNALQQEKDATITALERTLQELRDELNGVLGALKDEQGTRERVERDLETTRQEVEQSGRRADDHQRVIEDHKRRLAELENELQLSRSEGERTRHERDELTREREELNRARDELTRERDTVVQERDIATRELATATRELEHARRNSSRAERMTAALQRFTEASSFGDILDGLARSARQESGRAAVFLIRGQKLHGWRALGFDGTPIEGADFDFERASLLPVLAGPNGGGQVAALPVEVGGSVIAVLYVDSVKADTPEGPEWLDMVSAMAKHAGRALEAMTIRRAVAMLWSPGAGVTQSLLGSRDLPSVGLS